MNSPTALLKILASLFASWQKSFRGRTQHGNFSPRIEYNARVPGPTAGLAVTGRILTPRDGNDVDSIDDAYVLMPAPGDGAHCTARILHETLLDVAIEHCAAQVQNPIFDPRNNNLSFGQIVQQFAALHVATFGAGAYGRFATKEVVGVGRPTHLLEPSLEGMALESRWSEADQELTVEVTISFRWVLLQSEQPALELPARPPEKRPIAPLVLRFAQAPDATFEGALRREIERRYDEVLEATQRALGALRALWALQDTNG